MDIHIQRVFAKKYFMGHIPYKEGLGVNQYFDINSLKKIKHFICWFYIPKYKEKKRKENNHNHLWKC